MFLHHAWVLYPSLHLIYKIIDIQTCVYKYWWLSLMFSMLSCKSLHKVLHDLLNCLGLDTLLAQHLKCTGVAFYWANNSYSNLEFAQRSSNHVNPMRAGETTASKRGGSFCSQLSPPPQWVHMVLTSSEMVYAIRLLVQAQLRGWYYTCT